jgi:hypothetical protein
LAVMNAANEPVTNRIFLGDFRMFFREEIIIVVRGYNVLPVLGIPWNTLLINVNVFLTVSPNN